MDKDKPIRTIETTITWAEGTDEYVPILKIDGAEEYRGRAFASHEFAATALWVVMEEKGVAV